MKQEVNYIKHQKAVFEKMAEDDLSPLHISMYNALFYIWNDSMFDSELNIHRNEVMNFSKIKNVTTYTNTLRELEKLGYLKYMPSHNPLKCSKVTMYTFGHSGVTTTVTTTVQSGGNTAVHTDATLYKLLNLETIKLINDNADLVNLNLATWINDSLTTVEQGLNNCPTAVEIDETIPDKFVAPDILEVKEYFFSKQKDLWEEFFIDREIKKYYDYYVGNGWKVAKKPMKDWKGAVRNWINNCSSIPIKKPKPDNLFFVTYQHTTGQWHEYGLTEKQAKSIEDSLPLYKMVSKTPYDDKIHKVPFQHISHIQTYNL